MPKGVPNIKDGRKCKIEKFEIIIFSENGITKEINKRENNNVNKKLNKFIYSTPISFEKYNYLPSTPKKRDNKDNDDNYIVRGRDLSKLFESL